MANDLRLKLKIDADTKELIVTQRDMNKLTKSLDAGSKKAESFGQKFMGIAKATAVVYGLKQAFDGIVSVGQDFIQTASTFETFETVLTTIEGSSSRAKESMSWITDFTKNTPYQLEEVTSSFVKMKAYGIDLTNGTLRTLGDTAAAMGKPLEQAVEAMADAMTGENERLKEFGVKASIEGDNVAYSWMNASGEARNIVVENNSEVIQSTLNAIFNSRYEGAMKQQENTWKGMWSNIKDNWTILKENIMDGGLFNYFKAITMKIGELFKASFSDMADAGKEGANYIIKYFNHMIIAAGHVADAIDTVESGFLFFQNIGAFIKKAELYFIHWKDIVINQLIDVNNYIAKSSIGQFFGYNRTRSKIIIDEEGFKAQIDGVNNYIKNNALKIGDLFKNDKSEIAESFVLDIENNVKKLQNSVKNITFDKTDYGNAGSYSSSDSSTIQKEAKEREKALEKFADAYYKSTLSQTEYAKKQLADQFDYYDKYVTDKIDLQNWYDEEYQKIMDNRTSLEKTWQEGFSDGLKTYVDNSKDMYSQLNGFVSNSVQGMENLFTNFFTKGKFEFSDFINSIWEDFTRIMVRKNITSPLADAAGSIDWGSTFGGLFSAHGNAFTNNGVQAFATGGAFTNTLVSKPTMFEYGDSFGSGLGVMGEAGPEAVMPLTRVGSDLGVKTTPSNVILKITNNTSSEITANQVSSTLTTNSNGETERVIGIVMSAAQTNKNNFRTHLKGLLK